MLSWQLGRLMIVSITLTVHFGVMQTEQRDLTGTLSYLLFAGTKPG